MRYFFVALLLSLSSLAPAHAQVGVDVGLPGISIGINVPMFPDFVRVPGYPVYYAPRASSNYFFYDGFYWVYWGDNWYSSSWYNGPWELVRPEYVPLFLLRVPVRYYRRRPAYFRGWRTDAPPRWGERWGRDWEQRRSGWDRWDGGSAPAPAPLPVYQRQYYGDRYPRAVEQQRSIQSQNYSYQPREVVTRQPLAAPPQIRHEAAPPPQDSYQAAPPPQNRGQEKKAAVQHRESKPPKQNKGQEKKHEREQDRN